MQSEFQALCVRRGCEHKPGHWQRQSCCGSPIQLRPPMAYFCINKLSVKAAYSKVETAKNKLHYPQRRAVLPSRSRLPFDQAEIDRSNVWGSPFIKEGLWL